MNIKVLDASTLGEDLDLSVLEKFGNLTSYKSTPPEKAAERVSDADIIVVNKVKIDKNVLSAAKSLKLICIAATGYDNIDCAECKKLNIAVCNVEGYSTDSVAQITAASVLHLACNYGVFLPYVSDGSYSKSGVANKVSPPFYELRNKTWGIVGYGNIGRQVAAVARAFGCKVIACKRKAVEDVECVDIDTLCSRSDIITLHVPLNDRTRGMINRERINKMKNVILVNVARGAVADEEALVYGVKSGHIAGLGADVYGTEPMPESHPLYEIRNYPNVCLTPHTAWAAYEARKRCLDEIVLNAEAFLAGERRNRVD